MKIEISSDVSHKKNGDYTCLIIQFDPNKDPHYFANKHNWMPKSIEAFALFELMFAIDPKFRSLVNHWIVEVKK